MYETLGRVFHHISKHREVRYKNSAAPRFFNTLLGVWICDETILLVFHILLLILKQYHMGLSKV